MNTTNNNNKITKTKTKRKKARIKSRLPNNRKKRVNIIRGRKIAAASAKNFNKRFNVLRQNGNSVRVTGRDLIYSIPDDLTSPIQTSNVITVIPANPAYWKGTRIAALAAGYQNYRPILFKITYVPMCAVTQQGNVIGGTIWDDGIDNANIQQSLRTSNGGFMTQCYVPHTTRIRPKSNLQFNLYRMGGDFTTTSNPFIFVALAIGCKDSSSQRITPGYFYVTWSFELKNPIGSVNSYNNSGLIQYEDIKNEMNTTMINLDPNSSIPFGAYINVEEEEGALVPYYNETAVDILGPTPTWVFTSVSKSSNAKSVAKIRIVYDGISTTDAIIGKDTYQGFIRLEENYYDIYVFKTNPTYKYKITTDDRVFLLNDIKQNFGEYLGSKSVSGKQIINEQEITSSWSMENYKADKDLYYAVINDAKTKRTINNTKQEDESNKINKLKVKINKSDLLKIQEQLDYNSEDDDEKHELIAETETFIKPKEKSKSKKKKIKEEEKEEEA
jgi:hypothetical protein